MLKQLVFKDNEAKGIRKLLPAQRLSTHFPEKLADNNVHIIVEPPIALLPAPVAPYVPSHIPAKRELEFTLGPSKRLKLGFPVDSVSNFKELRDDNLFYVDKTKYIKEIKNDREVLMFLRPKRFGKSLLLSTIQHFYDINEAQIDSAS